MNEAQIAGLLAILLGALPCFLIAIYTQKTKRYDLFTSWNPSKIADKDAFGKMLCRGVVSFSIGLAIVGTLMMANIISSEIAALGGTCIALVPMYYYMRKAKRLYGK